MMRIMVLLHGPLRRWVLGNVAMDDVPPVMGQDNEYKQDSESGRGHGELGSRSCGNMSHCSSVRSVR
jgi:hypothetical protein